VKQNAVSQGSVVSPVRRDPVSGALLHKYGSRRAAPGSRFFPKARMARSNPLVPVDASRIEQRNAFLSNRPACLPLENGPIRRIQDDRAFPRLNDRDSRRSCQMWLATMTWPENRPETLSTLLRKRKVSELELPRTCCYKIPEEYS